MCSYDEINLIRLQLGRWRCNEVSHVRTPDAMPHPKLPDGPPEQQAPIVRSFLKLVKTRFGVRKAVP